MNSRQISEQKKYTEQNKMERKVAMVNIGQNVTKYVHFCSQARTRFGQSSHSLGSVSWLHLVGLYSCLMHLVHSMEHRFIAALGIVVVLFQHHVYARSYCVRLHSILHYSIFMMLMLPVFSLALHLLPGSSLVQTLVKYNQPFLRVHMCDRA